MSRELLLRITRLEAAAVIEAQRRTSSRHLSPEELDDRIVALAERWVIENPSSPIVAEVRACLDAGDRHGAMSILKRVFESAPR